MVTCGDDCKLKFWDMRSLTQPLLQLTAHSHWYFFCEDGGGWVDGAMHFFFSLRHTRHTLEEERECVTWKAPQKFALHWANSHFVRVWSVRYNHSYDQLLLSSGSDGMVCF